MQHENQPDMGVWVCAVPRGGGGASSPPGCSLGSVGCRMLFPPGSKGTVHVALPQPCRDHPSNWDVVRFPPLCPQLPGRASSSAN